MEATRKDDTILCGKCGMVIAKIVQGYTCSKANKSEMIGLEIKCKNKTKEGFCKEVNTI
jgi:hypothetical protein